MLEVPTDGCISLKALAHYHFFLSIFALSYEIFVWKGTDPTTLPRQHTLPM